MQHSLPRSWHGALLALLLVGYALLLSHHLASAMVWNDEGLSFFVAVDGFRHAIDRVARDVHAPLYYLLLSLPLKLSHGLLALRAISAIAAMITLIFVYLAARRLMGRDIALVAALIFAISPDNLDWAQHARPYSLQTMLVAISFWGFVHILLADRHADRLIGSGIAAAFRQRAVAAAAPDLYWLAYALGGGLAMLTQHPGGFYILACSAVMAVVIFRDLARNKILLLNWILANLLVVAIWLIWLPWFLVQVSQHLLGGSIEERHTNYLVDDPWEQFVARLGVASLWRLQPIPVLIYLAIVAVGLWRALRSGSAALWVFLLLSVPLAVCLIAYYLVHPMFGHVIFTLHWMAVPYAILVAFGIAALRYRVVQAGAVLVLLALNARGLSNYYQDVPMSRPDQMARFLAENADRSDGIIFAPSGSYRFGVAYYLGPGWMVMPGMDPVIAGERLITTLEATRRHPRTWVLVQEDQAPAVPFAALQGYGTLGLEKRFGKVILRRYDRAG